MEEMEGTDIEEPGWSIPVNRMCDKDSGKEIHVRCKLEGLF
jgi:hypothetical protein